MRRLPAGLLAGGVILFTGLAIFLAFRSQRPETGMRDPEREDEDRGASGRNRSAPPAERPAAEFFLRRVEQRPPERLREALRTDEAERRRAIAALLSLDTDEATRIRLVLILGTIPHEEIDETILEALERHGDSAAFVRAALLALGATRDPPEDDEIFGLGDRPWGVQVTDDIGITVRRRIGDEVADRAAPYLDHRAADVRRAAAVALRFSLDSRRVRTGFLSRLHSEPEDEVASVLGEALAGRASRVPERERQSLIDAVFSRIGEAGFDAYRFRMENDLRGVPLTSGQTAILARLAGPGNERGVRYFALTVLTRSARKSDAVQETKDLLLSFLPADLPEIRDLCAGLLVELPADAEVVAALARSAREDPQWNVRYTALASLAKSADADEVRPVLTAAAEDPDERVASKARQLLSRLR